ncbi:hypothetical protein [Microbacterium sp. Se5.02b]|uniref:hypothetical protein n=1 Tax=Microbacterium sp. Se5.02b TaxID=2864103 RepID=UPI001C68BAED|nr:hypothetical protein [Microbacterium sp. Se5.02b]QYM63251.1 hypothetical protein K1X59_13330 [Microbacterium sp. Se5.02b]
MPADPLSIRDAWSKIPSPGGTETEFERFTGKRMERILAIVVALGSAVLGAQALIGAVNSLSRADVVHIVMLVVVFVPLAAMLVACLVGRGVRTFSGAFAVVYVLALAAWPTVVDPADKSAGDQPWIFFLVNVGVVAAMLAFPLWLQFAWAAGMPLVYGYVRLVQGEFSREFWVTTAFDVSFTLILGVVMISLGWMFRSVAAGVDEARAQAVSSYSTAAAARRRRGRACGDVGVDARQCAGRAHRRRAGRGRPRERARGGDGARGSHPPREHGGGRRAGGER